MFTQGVNRSNPNLQPRWKWMTPAAMREAVGLALEAWEMLVVDVTMVDAEVPKKYGMFGQCVPKEWYNEMIGDERVLFDVVACGLRVNTAGEDEKKHPAPRAVW